jgi:diguanylate cyclase (GGDEF)-like protein
MNVTKRYSWLGALLGVCLIAAAFALILGSGSVSAGAGLLGTIAEAHGAHPLLYLVDTLPLILAGLGWLAGDREARLLALNESLRREVSDRTEALQAAREEARRAGERAEAMAELDALTGVFSRRRLYEELQRTIKMSARYQRSAALLYVDVDGFRALNEKLGRHEGSKLLGLIAMLIMRGVRATDSVGRWGGDTVGRLAGDDFVVLLPETDLAGAKVVVERLLQMVRTTPLLVADTQITASVSIGVSIYPAHADEANALVERAAAALDVARREGGDRCAVFEPS